jgi:hypothetical protein
MTYSHLDPAMHNRVAWNAGKTVGTKRPLTQKQIWAIRFFLDREERLRDRALFDLAIDSKLRGCDLVKLKIGDLVALLENSSQGVCPSKLKVPQGSVGIVSGRPMMGQVHFSS